MEPLRAQSLGQIRPGSSRFSLLSCSVMPVHFPDEAVSPEEKRVLLFGDLCFGRGWMRYMPPASILIMGALANQDPSTKSILVIGYEQGAGTANVVGRCPASGIT